MFVAIVVCLNVCCEIGTVESAVVVIAVVAVVAGGFACDVFE